MISKLWNLDLCINFQSQLGVDSVYVIAVGSLQTAGDKCAPGQSFT